MLGVFCSFPDSALSNSRVCLTPWKSTSSHLQKDGSTAFFSAYREWDAQVPFLLTNGQVHPIPELDTIYNGVISSSGDQILYAVRGSDYTELYWTQRVKSGWASPTNLTEKTGISGGYFSWFNEDIVYFYVPENRGDLVIGSIEKGELSILERIDEVNSEHIEFSPFVGPNHSYLLFTRYVEGDESQQGIMYSQNIGTPKSPKWDHPQLIEEISYGWGAFVFNDHLYYTDGSNILKFPIEQLSIFQK